jgi:hypothetical protein
MIAGAAACVCSLPKRPVKKAPEWLEDRMEALRKMPPPTLAEVRRQFMASEEFRKKWKGGRVDDGGGLLNR